MEKPRPFYYTFPEYLEYCTKIKSNHTKNILPWLCVHEQNNEGKILLTTATRQELCEQLGITNHQLSLSLKQLVNLKILVGEKGTYYINPKLFWRGDLSLRKEMLKWWNKYIETKET